MNRRGGVGLVVLLAAFISLATSANVAAAPGDLDRSFGTGGWVDLSSLDGRIVDLAVGPGDSIFILSQEFSRECPGMSQCGKFYVARASRDGHLDVAFARRSGVVAESPGGSAHDLIVDFLGRPVIAISGQDGTTLARLLPDGAADPTFGEQGLATLERRIDDPTLALGADGSIALAGSVRAYAGASLDVNVVRILPDGRLAPDFAAGGIAGVDLGGADRVGGVSLVDGEVAVAVATSNECCGLPAKTFRVLRFAPTGGLLYVADPWVSARRVAERVNLPDALLPGPDGSLRVLGDASGGTLIAALRAAGRVDKGFGSRGFAIAARLLRGGVDDAGIDRGGRLVIGGTVHSSDDFENETRLLAVTRRRPDGRLDRTFGGGNLLVLGRGRDDSATSLGVGIQSDGGILLLGRWNPFCARVCAGGPTYSLARFVGGASRARCHGRRATIVGTRRSERIVGTPHRDVIAALGGRDRVHGLGGADLICGGRGGDLLFGGRGNDRLIGGRGNDRLVGRRGKDRLHGGPGRNRLRP